ncbi:MAG TPA: hypothetical protein VEA18_01025 [Candidatus Kapabacteria bacterium]|nr:hypothetical protein [Candidatus Kapabacteria bacterium]
MKKTIVLPDREEMLRRLKAADPDRYHEERLFPLFLKSAGRTLNATGVALMYELISYAYTFERQQPPAAYDMMLMAADKYIDALVDDPEVAVEAKSQVAGTLKNWRAMPPEEG